MKLNKKGGLILFNVLVLVVAIVVTVSLPKGTMANNETPANSAFDDINFYKCVVDAYNEKNETSLDYTTSLNDEQLQNITEITCSNEGKSDEDKISSVSGIEKLTSLTLIDLSYNLLTSIDVSKIIDLKSLDVSNNKLTSIDLSANESLTQLDIIDNPYSENLYVYKNKTIKLGDSVKIPSQLGWDSPRWESDDTNIVTIQDDNLVSALTVGSISVSGKVTDKYTITSTVNVVEVISSKYVINEDKSYIVITDFDEDSIKNNISASDNVLLELDLINYKLLAKDRYGQILKEFDLVGISSSEYDLNSDYIYVGADKFDLKKIDVLNCSKEIIDDKLQIKYNDYLIKELKVFSIDFGLSVQPSKVVRVVENFTYEEFINNITISEEITYKVYNGDSLVTSGNMLDGMVVKIYHNDEEIDKFDIMVSSYALSFDETLSVDEENKYIKYLNSFIVNDLTNKITLFGNDTKIVVYNNYKHEVEKGNEDFIASGDVLVVYVGDTVMDEYKLSVIGDLNGDGEVGLIDLVQMRKHIVEWIDPNTNTVYQKTGVYYYAMDMNEDNKISLIDLVRMRKMIAGAE